MDQILNIILQDCNRDGDGYGDEEIYFMEPGFHILESIILRGRDCSSSRTASPRIGEGQDEINSYFGPMTTFKEILVAAIRFRYGQSRECAIRTLGRLKILDADLEIELIGRLHDPIDSLRLRTAWTLGRLQSTSLKLKRSLRASLKEKHEKSVAAAILAIGEVQMNDRKTLRALQELLTHEEEPIRKVAFLVVSRLKGSFPTGQAETLSSIEITTSSSRNPELFHQSLFHQNLLSDDAEIRFAALRIVGTQMILDSSVREHLEKMLKDPNMHVRRVLMEPLVSWCSGMRLLDISFCLDYKILKRKSEKPLLKL